MALRVVREDSAMIEAERKKLEEELARKKKSLADLEAQLTGAPQGGAQNMQTRENFKGRIKQIRRDIAHVQEKLAAS
jgi:chromosome segregation ATPase